MNEKAIIKRLADREEIRDALLRYARGVDRGDWGLLRSAYHADGHDNHGEYSGGINGLIDWLEERFLGVDNSMHFLGNCLMEFTSDRVAFVETYFVSRRLISPTPEELRSLAQDDLICRQVWGRYIDRFEERDGAWRIASRRILVDTRYRSVAYGGVRGGISGNWGRRDNLDASYSLRSGHI